MAITSLGVESELQLPATTTRDPSCVYSIAYGNAQSRGRWARPGINLTASWILVGFVSAEPQQELPHLILKQNVNLKIDLGIPIVVRQVKNPTWYL